MVMETIGGETDARYQVQLEVFEGPLDLLLTLIEREELDITFVSLARVTSQYLQYIRRLDQLKPDAVADFVVVAAKLIYIKSLTLLPRPPAPDEEGEEEEDVGDDLLRQLREYRRFRDAAQFLGDRWDAGLHSYIRLVPPAQPDTVQFRLEGVSLDDLLQAAREALDAHPPSPPVSDVVAPLLVTVGEQMDLIRGRLKESQRIRFRALLQNARDRTEVIVTLMATLEMVKQLEAMLSQPEPFGEIWIEKDEAGPLPSQSSSAKPMTDDIG